jgi:hypothetical protein
VRLISRAASNLFGAIWLGLFLIQGSALACPNCNIYNHLDAAVKSAELIALCSVVARHDERKVEVTVTETISGDLAPGTTLHYEDYFRGRTSTNSTMIAVGRSSSSAGIYEVVLPLDLLPEIRRLLQKKIMAVDAADAAFLLTGVSTRLHHAGIAYYKAHPEAVQEALLTRIQQLRGQLADGPWYRPMQLDFGIFALMRHRSATAEAFAIQELDQWLNSTEPSAQHDHFSNPSFRLESLLSMIAEPTYAHLRPILQGLLNSVSEDKLADLSKNLIISGMMMPVDILKQRPDVAAASAIEKGVIEAAWGHHYGWSHRVAAKLRIEAEKIDAPAARPALEQLVAALRSQRSALDRDAKLDEEPWNAALGMAIESSLLDQDWWDQIEPQKPPAPAWMWVTGLILLAVMYAWAWFRHLHGRMIDSR